MVLHYSIAWESVSHRKNFTDVRVTFLNERGETHTLTKPYEGWIGVCTNHIERVSQTIQLHFPGHPVQYQLLGNAKKILPYFETRLEKGKLDYRSKPFYKVYTTACIKNVGRLFNRYKYSYYLPEDWLVRIYIDLCTRHDCHAFYHRWYCIDDSASKLLDALQPVPDRNDPPDWKFAAFDLESVPLQGNHVPMGHQPTDRITMISLFKWSRSGGTQPHLLYLLPEGVDQPLAGYEQGAFQTEKEMLRRFHQLLEDVQVVTGYNINSFDFPCLFARLVWLNMPELIRCYTSRNVGMDVVPTYKGKLTIDLYAYFKTFSGYNLPSFKLDDVARIKLEGEALATLAPPPPQKKSKPTLQYLHN